MIAKLLLQLRQLRLLRWPSLFSLELLRLAR
jgi:hypothetical protein